VHVPTKADFDVILQKLFQVESDLSTAIAAFPQRPELPYSRETLLDLKGIVDRIRPLLWIHLNQATAAEKGKSPVDDCMEMASKAVGDHLGEG
jgi:hypothetical protein